MACGTHRKLSNANQGHEVHIGAKGQALTCLVVDGEGGKTRETRARFAPERLRDVGERDEHNTTVGTLEMRAARARFLFIAQSTRDNDSVYNAPNRSKTRASGTRLAQMKGPEMRGGLARFRTGARSQSRHRQTVGGGEHLTSSLPKALVFYE